jgi:hypothetical protein
MNAIATLLLIPLSGAVLLTGCATPRPVLDLASQGMVIAGKTESELQAFVARSDRIYEQRLASVRGLALGDIEANTKTEFENYTAERAGMGAEVERAKLIRDLADFRAKLRDKALAEQVDLEKRLADSGEVPQVPKEKLAELRNALAQLSEELSTEEWLTFAFRYGKQVYASYKQSKAKAAKVDAK